MNHNITHDMKQFFLRKLRAVRCSLNVDDDAETHLKKIKEICRLENNCRIVLKMSEEEYAK